MSISTPLGRSLSPMHAAATPLREMLGYDPFRSFFDAASTALDVTAHDSGWTVEMPVPGFAAGDIDLVFKDDILTVNGKNEKRSFSRSLRLPQEIDPDAIEAQTENGILTVELRRHPHAEPRRIEVKEKSAAQVG